jgi:eukaryotic-like serine/threonine-protein kinase
VSSSPAIVSGVVYIGSYDNNVYALNASTGQKVWAFKTGEQVQSSPAVDSGVVFIGSSDDFVYALTA